MSSPFAPQNQTSRDSNADSGAFAYDIRGASGSPSGGTSPFRHALTKLLATLAALAFTVGSLWLFMRDSPDAEYFSTRVGERLPVRIPDGSVITLNTDSRIKLHRDGQTLSVQILKGEVHFNMVPNSQRHLVVSVGERIQITDIATIFDVRLIDPSGARVTVQEGQVKVSVLKLADVQLQENQQTAVTSDEARITIRTRHIPPRQVEREFSWLQGTLDFQCDTLGNVAKEFNRYNQTHIEVMDDTTAKVPIGGAFSTTNPTAFAKLIADVSPNMRLETAQHTGGYPVLQLRALDPAVQSQSHCSPEGKAQK
jgi:transmembrane sensor